MTRHALAAFIASGAWRRMVDAGLVRGWFDEFRRYWVDYCHHRPMEWPDFFYQMGELRSKQQAAPSTRWDDPALAYLLFRHVYREAVQPLRPWHWAKYLTRSLDARTLDFGCGIGSVGASLQRYWPHRAGFLWRYDIPSPLSAYAKWRFPTSLWLPDWPHQRNYRAFDTIICLETLEHVEHPWETITFLISALNFGGRLVLDFALTAGEALDSPNAENERARVYCELATRCTRLYGALPGVSVWEKIV